MNPHYNCTCPICFPGKMYQSYDPHTSWVLVTNSSGPIFHGACSGFNQCERCGDSVPNSEPKKQGMILCRNCRVELWDREHVAMSNIPPKTF